MTGILIFCNRAPIIWNSKRQNRVETSMISLDFTAMNNVVELIAPLWYKLIMFCVPIDVSTDMFCNNEAVYKNTSMPEKQLWKKNHSIAYQMSRESVASGAFRIAKEDTWTNLADIFTKVLPSPRRELLLNNFTYWINGWDEISNLCIAEIYIGWGDRINSTTMGYISAVIPLVQVNCAEEGTRNPGFILL